MQLSTFLRTLVGSLTSLVIRPASAHCDTADGPAVADVCPTPDGVRPLVGLVGADGDLTDVLASWLARVFVADDLGGWLDRHGELPPGVTLVSRDGRLLSRHALIHYAPDSRTQECQDRAPS